MTTSLVLKKESNQYRTAGYIVRNLPFLEITLLERDELKSSRIVLECEKICRPGE